MKLRLFFVFALAAIAAGIAPSRAQTADASAAPSFDVVVKGQVLHPGTFTITSNYTVIDAIELAGGFTPRALRSKITVTHRSPKPGEAKTAQLDYSDVEELNPANADFRLEPGDVIYVPADPTYGT